MDEMSMAIQKTMTVEEFEEYANLPENADLRLEFIDGEMIEVPSNAYSSEINALIMWQLGNHVYPRGLGHITGEGGGYKVAGARLAPDAAFVSKARQGKLDRQGYNSVAPDLAIEVMSPTDKDSDLEKKLKKYAEAGTVAWVFYPDTRLVKVHIPGQPEKTLGSDETLEGGEVLPGFTLRIGDIFPED
jgi:Uma2 family endonuclease